MNSAPNHFTELAAAQKRLEAAMDKLALMVGPRETHALGIIINDLLAAYTRAIKPKPK